MTKNFVKKWPSDVRKCEFQYGGHQRNEFCRIRTLTAKRVPGHAHIFAPRLKQTTKMCPRARFIVKIHFFQNRTWLLPPFWNQSNGDNSANIEQIGTKFDRQTDSPVLEHVSSVRPSVCLSVCPSVCYVQVCFSHRLEYFRNIFTAD